VNVPAHDPPTPARSHLVVQSADPLFTRPGRVLVARAIVESTDTSQLIRPAASAKHGNAVTIWRHVPSRCHR
jgi:hypothetical protein